MNQVEILKAKLPYLSPSQLLEIKSIVKDNVKDYKKMIEITNKIDDKDSLNFNFKSIEELSEYLETYKKMEKVIDEMFMASL